MAASSDPIRLEGVYVAVVTPFDDDGVVLWSEFEAVIRRQIDAGVDGIVLLGSTGEWPTLTPEELRESVTRGVALCAGKVQCVVGTGTNCTRTTVEMTRFAKDAGADCCMVVNPYYNKPQQRGMIAHIRAVADVGLPIMLYNNVGRSAVKLEVETVLE
jgi:4-hydroxy-tetrahydrodipicolinate synthase